VSTRIIVISGSMGSGKTTVLGEASDLLSACHIAHATVDLDAIGTALLPDDVARDLIYRNLEALYVNFSNAGITRILLAEAVESRAELERIRRAMPGAEFTVARLTAAVETMQRRLRNREPGMLQEQFLARARELDRLLENAALEDLTIANDEHSVTDVARELLQRADWIPGPRSK
jgi:predicted kinase